MERCRQTENEEQAAKLFLNSENSGNKTDPLDLVTILSDRIYKSNSNPMYYSGGLRMISSLCNESNRRQNFYSLL